ncbi:single-stranded DNA-binding protein [Candidatus Saccharibacteria bacterium]|jgi:spoIIIJ-associated protein|nr:single-stranded DNA-binding protein [Candidatus Saccharibacteria bacterium]
MNKEESIQFATRAVQDIVSFFEVNVDVRAHLEDDVINISVESSPVNSILIGRNAETLRSIQALVISMLHNNNAELTRLNVDIADYKKQRADKLAEKARGWIDRVIETGESYTVSLNAADRRIVHKVATEYAEVSTHSEGEGRERRLIIDIDN